MVELTALSSMTRRAIAIFQKLFCFTR